MTFSAPLDSIIILADKSKNLTDQCERSVKKSTPTLSYQIHLAGYDPNVYNKDEMG
jgi:hypothetical protein